MKRIKQYSRPRPFVALTADGRRECCMSSTNAPTKKMYTGMIGPFKTRRAQHYYRDNPAIFARTINQVEQTSQLANEEDLES